MMKKIIVFVCLFMVCMTGCGQEKKQQPSLYDKGLEVCETLSQELNENYVGYFSTAGEITALVEELSGQDYSAPQSVYQLNYSESGMRKLIFGLVAGNDEEVPEPVQKRLNNLLYIVNIINARKGTAYLALSSILTADELFVNDTVTENTAYLYFYENAYPVFVFYQIGEDGAIHATGSFLFSDEIKEQGVDVLNELMGPEVFGELAGVVEITQIK